MRPRVLTLLLNLILVVVVDQAYEQYSTERVLVGRSTRQEQYSAKECSAGTVLGGTCHGPPNRGCGPPDRVREPPSRGRRPPGGGRKPPGRELLPPSTVDVE